MRRFPSLLLVCGVAACSSTLPPDPALELGVYGGEGARVTVEPTLVGFGFDCAGGAVDHRITLAPDGSFDELGTWANGGNANGVDHTPQPARYVGKVTGTHIRFQLVRPPDGSTPAGSFDVDLGVAPRLIAC